jgi:hypothetical protein
VYKDPHALEEVNQAHKVLQDLQEYQVLQDLLQECQALKVKED